MKVKVVQTFRGDLRPANYSLDRRRNRYFVLAHTQVLGAVLQTACVTSATIILDAGRHYAHALINEVVDSFLTTLKVPAEQILCDAAKNRA